MSYNNEHKFENAIKPTMNYAEMIPGKYVACIYDGERYV